MVGSKSRSIVVTGANRGLGLEVCRRLAAAGHALLVTGRDELKARNAARMLDREFPSAPVASRVLDLSSLESVRECAQSILERDAPVDVLVHNAGMLFPTVTRTVTDDGVEEALQVHAVAPLLLTRLLLPILNRPARVYIVGSSLHYPDARGPSVDFRFEDPNLEQRYLPERAYKNSKLAALWVAYEFERRLGDAGVHFDVVSPGFVPTTAAPSGRSWFQRAALKHVLPRMPFATSIDDAAGGLARLFGDEPLDAEGGRYFHEWKPRRSSEQSLDEAQAGRFWRWACDKAQLPETIRTDRAG
ncbi:MAG: SDR family NAD(P)-dependent oxidoreductase [Myxococcota bacterium]